MENAALAVSALARQVPRTVFLLREFDAAVYQIADSLGRMLADFAHDVLFAQPGAGNHGVFHMLVERVGRIHHATDAALGIIGIAILQAFFRDKDDFAFIRELEGGDKPGHAGTDDKVVAIHNFHGTKAFRG